MLLLHGWIGSSNDLSAAALALSKAGLEVYVPDLPYHAKSVRICAESPSDGACKVFQAFNLLLSKKCNIVLCGYSMGGRLVLEMLRDWELINSNSHALKGVIFISSSLPPTGNNSKKQMMEREARTAFDISSFETRTEFEHWLRTDWYSKTMWGDLPTHQSFEVLIESRLANFGHGQTQAWASAAKTMGTSKMKEYSEGSNIPILYLYGSRDTKYKDMALNYSLIFPNSVCSVVANCGHNVLAENQPAVESAIYAFLLKSCRPCHILIRALSIKSLPYQLKLLRGMSVKGQKITYRKGVLVAVTFTCGSRGVGDVVPLPGWHSVTLQAAQKELSDAIKELKKNSFCPQCFSLADLRTTLNSTSAVVSWAIEAAIIQGLASSIDRSYVSFIAQLRDRARPSNQCEEERQKSNSVDYQRPRKHVFINGVLPRALHCNTDISIPQDEITDFVAHSPFNVLKLKVGVAQNVEDDVRFVKSAVAAATQCEKTIRLDANQAWDLDRWKRFRDGVADNWFNIGLIEEPLQSSVQLVEAIKQGEIPKDIRIGFDESLVDCSNIQVSSMIQSASCAAIVVKPTMFKSMSRIFELADTAIVSNADVIVSSTFESGVGLAWLAHIAASIDKADTYHGLGTFANLKDDVISPSFQTYCTGEKGICLDLEKCAYFLEACSRKVIELGSDELVHGAR